MEGTWGDGPPLPYRGSYLIGRDGGVYALG